MEKSAILNRINEIYKEGGNVIQYLRSISSSNLNSLEDILISYDFQAGSYIESVKNNPEIIDKYTSTVAKVINEIGKFDSILEVGVGEATCMGNVLKKLQTKPKIAYGFDLSWSRIKYGKHYLKTLGIDNVFLSTGDLFHSPYKDNSFDIVYTSHSIEPNGGREKEALEELFRITNKYLILLEPAFEFATEEGKKRMLSHGYVKDLFLIAQKLGYKIIEHRLFDLSINPLNPTGLIIIEKLNNNINIIDNPLACPLTKTNLIKHVNEYFSPESLLAYPIIGDIPCLLPQNAVIASHFLDKF